MGDLAKIEKVGTAFGTTAVVVTDDPTVRTLARLNKDGTLRSVRATMHLNPAANEVQRIKGKWAITAAGYNRMNLVSGIDFIQPEQPEFHRENGDLVYVRVRNIGYGRNTMGNWNALDMTLTFNVQLYFAESLFKKITASTNSVSWAQVYSTENVPDEVASDATKKVIRCPGGLSIAVDLMHSEARDLFRENITNHKFAERKAQTMCRRNILKAMTGASILNDQTFAVQVVGWTQPDTEWTEKVKLAVDCAEGRPPIIGVEHVQVDRKEVELDGDDVELAGDDFDDRAKPVESDDADEEKLGTPITPPPPDKALDAALAEVREAASGLDDESVDRVLSIAGFKSLTDIVDHKVPSDLTMLARMFRNTAKAKEMTDIAAPPPDVPGQLAMPFSKPPSPTPPERDSAPGSPMGRAPRVPDERRPSLTMAFRSEMGDLCSDGGCLRTIGQSILGVETMDDASTECISEGLLILRHLAQSLKRHAIPTPTTADQWKDAVDTVKAQRERIPY